MLADRLLETLADQSVFDTHETRSVALAALHNSAKFDISQVARYYAEGTGKEDWPYSAFPCVAPPFSVCWMEWPAPTVIRIGEEVRYANHNLKIRMVSIVRAIPIRNGLSARSVVDAYMDGLRTPVKINWMNASAGIGSATYPRWMLLINHLVRAEGYPVKRWGRFDFIALDSSGAILKDGCVKVFEPGFPQQDDSINPPLLALSFLNTVNKRTVEHVPERALQKARLRKAKPPLVSYSEIVVPGYASGGGASSDRNRETSLHVVRGHFKRRATGVFWWHPFLRGQYEKGVTLSRYAVGPRP